MVLFFNISMMFLFFNMFLFVVAKMRHFSSICSTVKFTFVHLQSCIPSNLSNSMCLILGCPILSLGIFIIVFLSIILLSILMKMKSFWLWKTHFDYFADCTKLFFTDFFLFIIDFSYISFLIEFYFTDFFCVSLIFPIFHWFF